MLQSLEEVKRNYQSEVMMRAIRILIPVIKYMQFKQHAKYNQKNLESSSTPNIKGSACSLAINTLRVTINNIMATIAETIIVIKSNNTQHHLDTK